MLGDDSVEGNGERCPGRDPEQQRDLLTSGHVRVQYQRVHQAVRFDGHDTGQVHQALRFDGHATRLATRTDLSSPSPCAAISEDVIHPAHNNVCGTVSSPIFPIKRQSEKRSRGT